MSKICLTCKVSKSMNKAELEKVIPDWYKDIGNYSLLPPILNNNDKYNTKKTTLQTHKPNITDYEVKINIKDKKNTWICYWAANYTDKYDEIKTAKQAYDKFQNHGLIETDGSGKAVFTLNCPQPYSVDGKTYPRHVHYCLNENGFWSDKIKTVIVSCNVDYDIMKKIVNSDSHIIINALPKKSFERCNIPNSINIPLLTFNSDNAVNTIRKSLNDFDKLKKFHGKKIFETPIVVYCKNTDCKASEKMIELLIEVGFRNLLEYSEGIIGWMRKSKSKKNCEEISGGSGKNSTSDKEESKEEDDESLEEDKEEKEEKEYKEEKEDKEDKKSKSEKVKNEYNLSGNFETVVFDGNKYQHDLKTKDILKKGKIIGEYDGDKINFKEVDGEDSSSDEENDDYTSSDEDVRDESDSVNNIKYRKHKLKLVCMNDITPKIYDERFRGWGFTFWY